MKICMYVTYSLWNNIPFLKNNFVLFWEKKNCSTLSCCGCSQHGERPKLINKKSVVANRAYFCMPWAAIYEQRYMNYIILLRLVNNTCRLVFCLDPTFVFLAGTSSSLSRFCDSTVRVRACTTLWNIIENFVNFQKLKSSLSFKFLTAIYRTVTSDKTWNLKYLRNLLKCLIHFSMTILSFVA